MDFQLDEHNLSEIIEKFYRRLNPLRSARTERKQKIAEAANEAEKTLEEVLPKLETLNAVAHIQQPFDQMREKWKSQVGSILLTKG